MRRTRHIKSSATWNFQTEIVIRVDVGQEPYIGWERKLKQKKINEMRASLDNDMGVGMGENSEKKMRHK